MWFEPLSRINDQTFGRFGQNGKQYVAVATGNGSGLVKSLGTLATEIRNPDGGSMLWVFALPEK